MEKFRKLGLIEPIINSIREYNFEKPSEIQEKSIPLVMEGKDVIAGASTGSGKTLAFASGIIHVCERGKGIQALVLTPTRELAEQVSHSLQGFSKNKHLEIISVYGGVGIEPQIKQLRSADVVVGTPGRILDHIARKTIDFRNLKILVLDEADRMLDMGFKDDVEKIIYECPGKRQTLLFSATISADISLLAKRYMKNPVEVSAEVYVDPSKLTQIYYDVDNSNKFSLLVHLLKNEKSELIMVFCNTKRNTDLVAKNLNKLGIDAIAIHGGHSQMKRSTTMKKFSSQHISVLVCTDIAARGLDIHGVSHVYNYDTPADRKDYIHRIGRTARAGNEGKVINIISKRDYENFGKIIQNRELNIKQEETPEVERVYVKFKDEEGEGNFYGKRRQQNYGREKRYDRYSGERPRINRHSERGDSERDERRGSRSFGHRRDDRKRHDSRRNFGKRY